MKRFHVAFGFAALSLALAVGCGSNDNGSTSLDPNTTGAGADGGASATPPGPGFETPVNDPNADAGPAVVDGACGGTMMKATARDANLLLLVDRSGSMRQRPAGFTSNKWDGLKVALREALTPVKGKINLGLQMFPAAAAATGDACSMMTGAEAIDVPIAAGDTTLDKILDAVNTTTPAGATPTAKALAEAHAYFTTGAGKDLKGDKYVILATDGGPNCGSVPSCGADMCTTNIDGSCTMSNCCDPATGGSRISCLDADGVVTQLEALKSAGVKTFVIGIPGTEAYKSYLDKFAEAGGFTSTTGSSKYFAVSSEGGVGGLTSVFALITGELITSCRVSLEQAAPDPTRLNVYVDEEAIPQGGENGWELDTSTDPPSIVIKGSRCEQVKAKGARVISVVYGCPTIR